jgi:hypothetical protein
MMLAIVMKSGPGRRAFESELEVRGIVKPQMTNIGNLEDVICDGVYVPPQRTIVLIAFEIRA